MQQRVRNHVIKHVSRFGGWRPFLVRVALVAVGLLLIVQFFYPGNRLLPLASLDGKNLGWQVKPDAIKALNAAYDAHPIEIFMGQSDKPVAAPSLGTAELTVDNTDRINSLNYPWYLRIIPTSLFWAHLRGSEVPAPKLTAGHDAYVEKQLMPECRKNPTNASLKPVGGKLELIKAVPGGQCEKTDVEKVLAAVRPRLDAPTKVTVRRKVLPPEINDADALAVKQRIEAAVRSGVQLQAGAETLTIPAADFVTWLDFAATDGKLTAAVNADRSKDFFDKSIAPKVSVPAGISRITTLDFTEISRVNGASGRALDVPKTLASLTAVANGAADSAAAQVIIIPPQEQYIRTYSASDAGLSALLTNYAKDHKGTFGISLIELDGKKRRASYQGDKQFVTASTYKLFVAYSTLKRIDNGAWSWDAEGACFNKMISYSDNACAENFLGRIGLATQTKEMAAIGLASSTFMKTGGPFTTANDLTLLLGMIATGQNFSSIGQTRLIAAMKANVYRQGIPAGASGAVADKVGFLNALLHDAAIVYGSNGTYVLAVMTDGSTWGTIADLTRQIETVRAG